MTNSDISGQITDGSGNPIGSAEVYLWREDLAGAGGVVASTTADSSGNFSFTAHPDGSGSSESWHIAAKDPNANVQLRSAYGVTASPPTSVNSQFNVSITGTSPSPVAPGETLTVDASLSNSGTDSDTQTLTLDVDNGVGQVDSSLEAAQGGASKTVSLSWAVSSGQAEQDYQATVSSADDSASQTVTVSSDPPPSLVSRWTFDDADTNSGTAVDTVGSNDGTIVGATTGVSGANQTYATNEAYEFDGVDDSVDVPGTPDFSGGELTLAVWVRPDTLSGAQNIIGQQELGGTSRNQRLMIDLVDSNTIEAVVFTTNKNNVSASVPASSVSTGTWHHVVGVFNHATNELKIYLNGSLEEGIGAESFDPALTDIQIGKSDGGGREFNGRIDDPRLYSKELTSTEISNLYNNGRI